jgi:hypothetical protein
MRHLDLDLLQGVLDGDVPPKTLLRRLLDHLGELCPECGEAVASLRQGSVVLERESGSPPAPQPREDVGAARAVTILPDPRFVGALDRAQITAADWTKKVRREQRCARTDLRELRRLPPERRAERVEHARSRFRSRALADLLVGESRRVVREDPAEAQSLAALVEVVLLWTPGALGQDWAREVGLRARAWEANAMRVAGELRKADRRFADLRRRLGKEMIVSEALHAEICSLEASLRIDQKQTGEGRRLLDQAIHLYRLSDDREALARVLIQKAILERHEMRFTEAVVLQQEVLRTLEYDRKNRLFLSSVINLGHYYCELGQQGKAAQILAEQHQGLVEGGVWEWPQMQALRGRIALEQDRPAEAERLFLAARTELVRRGDAVRAAVASLDLALLYLVQGKTAELRRMARLMGQVFEAEDLHEEAMATVVLFQQAVAAESLTVEALRAWRRQLETGGRSLRPRPVQPS